MSFSIIAAIGRNRELGKRGGLCFDIPGDLKFFRNTTMGAKVFMGLNTWKSLPKKLPGREHFVLTFPDAEISQEVNAVYDLEAFIREWQDKSEEVFVIGGGSVYAQMLKYCDKLYLTEIDAEDSEADTFFPEFNKNDYKRQILGNGEDHGLKYTHVLYKITKI